MKDKDYLGKDKGYKKLTCKYPTVFESWLREAEISVLLQLPLHSYCSTTGNLISFWTDVLKKHQGQLVVWRAQAADVSPRAMLPIR